MCGDSKAHLRELPENVSYSLGSQLLYLSNVAHTILLSEGKAYQMIS